jgi:hypothetical protein
MTPPENEHGTPRYVDVTIVEFAAHTAYLDLLTGVGYLLIPQADSDVDALVDPLVEGAWSEWLHDVDHPVHLSLHAADRQHALNHLGELGWALLYDEDGYIEIAGRTPDGREALCIYGDPTAEDLSLEALDCAVIALDIAAGLDRDSDQH